MHVLHAIAAARRGGAEQLLLLIARHLQQEGTRVTVLFFEDGPLRATFEEAGVACHVLGGEGRFRPVLFMRILRVLREVQPDAVHLHGLRALFHVAPVAKSQGIAVVFGAHAVSTVKDAVYGPLGAGYRRMEGALCRALVDAVIATSSRMRDDLVARSGVPSSMVDIVTPCIDLDRLPPVSTARRVAARARLNLDGAVVAMIGRLVQPKGHQVMIRALQALPGVTLLIAGEGPERGSLTSLARELEVSDRVVFAGEVDDVASVCHASDLVVYPSTEGIIGLAALEAMACGVPVIASHLAGVTEFVEPGVTGRLVAPGDPRQLARAVAALLEDREAATQLADAAMKSVRLRHSAASAGLRHRVIYEQVVSSTRPSAA